LALVVLRNRQHLAAMLVHDDALVLNTMRFADEVLPMSELHLLKPASGKPTGAHAREVEMATKLVQDMSEDWAPEQYRDTYRDDLMARIEEKIESGKTHQLTPAAEEPEAPRQGAKVIDMVALLKQSLNRRGKNEAGSDSEGRARRKAPARHAAAKKQTAAKRATAKHAPAKRATHATPARKAASSSSRPAAKRKHA
jgi:DNA end-binding protein Ku